MKKILTFLAIVILMVSCGGSDQTKPIEASYSDIPGPDSSILLPPKIEENPDSNISPITGDTLKPIE